MKFLTPPKPREEMTHEDVKAWYLELVKTPRELYQFLKKYTVFDVTVRIEEGTWEDDLCMGEPHISEWDVSIQRDFFCEYPSLTLDNPKSFRCIVTSLEYPEPDVVKINRTDGEIIVKGYVDTDRQSKRRTLDYKFKDLSQFTIKELIDEEFSIEVNGERYYVLDLFRIKKLGKRMMDKLRLYFKLDKYTDLAKTLYLKPTGKFSKDGTPNYEFGLWSYEFSCPFSMLEFTDTEILEKEIT